MPTYSGRVPLDRLREAVEDSVAASSLRGVAREVGMSPSGLQKFRDGATPYSSTRRKLEHWFMREAARREPADDAVPVLAALQLLTSGLPESERVRVAAQLIDEVESAYRARRLSAPPWIGAVRARLEGERGGE